MSALWNWETCLPVQSGVMPPHSTSPSPCPREIQARPVFRRPSRQKTPVIVHDQGLSRLRMKNNNAISRAPTARPHTSPGQRPGFVPGMPSALKGRSIPPKTPVIVHDQGISRHPQKNHPAPWKLAAWSCSGAWRLEFGASPPHPLCVKTPAIKAHRASSRQMQKSLWLSVWPIHTLDWPDSRTNAETYAREKSSPWGEDIGEGGRPTKLSGRDAMSTPAHQGKNPIIVHDQGISRHPLKNPNHHHPEPNRATP